MDGNELSSNNNGKEFVPTPAVMEPVPTREYSLTEGVFAWMSLFFGYLLCRVFPVTDILFGGFLLVVLMYTGTTVVLKRKRAEFGYMSVIAVVSAGVMSLSLVLTSNQVLHFFAYLYCLLTYCYYVHVATGNSVKKGFSDYLPADYYKALFILSKDSQGRILKALFTGKTKEGGKILGRIVLGVIIAIIPTVIVVSLLSYDSGFSIMMARLFDFSFGNLASQLICIMFAIPIGQYIFGMFISAVDKKKENELDEEDVERFKNGLKIVPVSTVLTAVLPLLIVYVVFFISQWKYYVSGFTGNLPGGFGYAEYAREGFFQLCTVSVINLIVLSAIVVFMRTGKSYSKIVLKSISIVFSVFTLILICTAVAKMVMYIGEYGLTQKRVYATWLMAVLTVIFVLIIIKQFANGFKLVAVSVSAVIIMFTGIALFNVDAYIVRYNVNRYLEGSLERFDVDSMVLLGDSAIPELTRLCEELADRYDADINSSDDVLENGVVFNRLCFTLKRLGEEYSVSSDKDIFSYTVPYLKAKRALEKLYEV